MSLEPHERQTRRLPTAGTARLGPTLLIRWHLQDLPDDTERTRNDAIEALQGTT